MTVNKIIPTIKKVLFATAAVVALAQCSEDESLKPSSIPTTSEATAASANTATVSSLTVTGSNTTYTTLPDCKTCTYIVAAKEQVVDGKSLGLKPGSIICLNTGVVYGNVEMINLEGTIEKPIVIATIGTQTAASTDTTSENDPY